MKKTITKHAPPLLNYRFYLQCNLLFLALFVNTSVFAQPANDECSNAIELTAGATLSYADYDNSDATNTSGIPTSSCINNPKSDVWFKVMVPSSGTLIIKGETYIDWEIVISVYSGDCGSLIYYDCEETTGIGSPKSVSIIDSALKGGYVYIQISNFTPDKGDVFQLGAYIDSTPMNNNPAGAIFLDNIDGTFSYTTYDSQNSNASISVANPPCGFYLGADLWFKSVVPTNGKMVINAKEGSINPALSLYTGTANNLTYYDCSSGNGGTEIILNDVALADEDIFIRAFGVNDVDGGTFDLLVLEPTQDYCSEAIALDGSSATASYAPYTNDYATTSTDGGTPGCGYYQGSDIWFVIDVPASGELVIDSKPSGDDSVKPILTAYTGTCSNLVEYSCAMFNSNGFGAKIEINDTDLANETIFLRAYNFNTAAGGAFELSVHNPAAPLPVDLVNFTASVFNTDVLLDWATASELNNDYFIVEHSVDGRNFTPIDHISGRGTTDEFQRYSFNHKNPYFGENYYRLKQVDYDGAFEYSKTVIAMIRLAEEQFKLFPNPAFTKEVLTIRWSDDFSDEELHISITDALGRQVYTKLLERGTDMETQIDCGAAKMDAGIYYVQLSNQQQVIAHRRFNLVKD